MLGRKAANASAVERINNKHGDREIDKSEYKRGVRGQHWRMVPNVAALHRKAQRFSSRSVVNSSAMVKNRMHTEIAAPSGQSYAAPNRLCTILAIIVADEPPTSSGARKSPRESTNANVAPASSPGMESGRITRRKVVRLLAPRSCEASSKGRGICSRAA